MKIYTTVEIDDRIYTGKTFDANEEEYRKCLSYIEDNYQTITVFRLETTTGFIFFSGEMIRRAIIRVIVKND